MAAGTVLPTHPCRRPHPRSQSILYTGQPVSLICSKTFNWLRAKTRFFPQAAQPWTAPHSVILPSPRLLWPLPHSCPATPSSSPHTFLQSLGHTHSDGQVASSLKASALAAPSDQPHLESHSPRKDSYLLFPTRPSPPITLHPALAGVQPQHPEHNVGRGLMALFTTRSSGLKMCGRSCWWCLWEPSKGDPGPAEPQSPVLLSFPAPPRWYLISLLLAPFSEAWPEKDPSHIYINSSFSVYKRTSLVAQNPHAMQEIWVGSLVWEDSLAK